MKRKDRKHQMERWSVGALERESWWHLFATFAGAKINQ